MNPYKDTTMANFTPMKKKENHFSSWYDNTEDLKYCDYNLGT